MKATLSMKEVRKISDRIRRRNEIWNRHSLKELYLTKDPNEVVFIHREKNIHGTRWMLERLLIDFDKKVMNSHLSRISSHAEILKMKLTGEIKKADESSRAYVYLKGMLDILRNFDSDTPADVEYLE
jgi:hypothetical protein